MLTGLKILTNSRWVGKNETHERLGSLADVAAMKHAVNVKMQHDYDMTSKPIPYYQWLLGLY